MTIKLNDFVLHFFAYYLAWFSAIFLAARQQETYSVLAVLAPVLFQVFWQYRVAKRTHGYG